ncbi:MAG: carboxypeptidase regulatory-like domain-containing protein [Bryobacterales bacterium]|nr:carboxypeptidase regulatory-like domain-containing protein [Bryobacterales bacterium]
MSRALPARITHSVTLGMGLLLAAAAAAQSDVPATTIAGTLMDGSTNLPIAGGKVVFQRLEKGNVLTGPRLFDIDPAKADAGGNAVRLATLTDAVGKFRFRVSGKCTFALFSDAPGYVRVDHVHHDNTYELDSESGKSGIVIRLTPQLTISGRVTDSETKQPVRGIAVVPNQFHVTSTGRVLFPSGNAATTDDSGTFRLSGLAPGEYYLEVRPPLGAKIQEAKPVACFRNLVQKSYTATWYPGVERSQDAVPLRLVDGSALDHLDIRIRKRKTASIRGRVLSAEDLGQADIFLGLSGVTSEVAGSSFRLIAGGKVKAGTQFQVDGLAPGMYFLTANTAAEQRRDMKSATLTLEVGDENQDHLDLRLRNGVHLRGRVQLKGRQESNEEFSLPVENMQVHLSPLVHAAFITESPVGVDSKTGAFDVEGAIPDRYRLLLFNAPAGYKIAETEYNGTLCANGILTIDPNANFHQLRIKLAPATSSLTITAADGTRPAVAATVLLVPDAVDDQAFYTALQQATTDRDGRVTIGQLLPGAYRVFAYTNGSAWASDPYLKQRVLAGHKVQLAENEAATLDLRPHKLN